MPLFFFVVLIVGILLGYFMNNRNRNNFNILVNNEDPLQEIMTLVRDQYVDSVNTDSLYGDAISGILKHLDPHTVYIPASTLESVNEDLEGEFKGIGVEFVRLNDTIEVASLIDGGPAQKAGIESGDRIIKVNDTLVSGVNISNDSLIRKLRGKENSIVQLGILRTGRQGLMSIKVSRGLIPLYSIDAAYMLDAKTAYIKINRFSATTYDEFRKVLPALQKEGMQQVILDLRSNPGGYLDAAIDIADEFINDDKLLVYTQGRKSKREEYKSGRPGVLEKGRLIVLIDESSASASEILSGAVQDWDRGVIMGRPSFGKGLVQEQFGLSNGAALRLTIARYYTPSGRSIQRPYNNGREAYEDAYLERLTDTNADATDTVAAAGKVYYSEISHRKLYGNGGIQPDILEPQDKLLFSPALGYLLSTDVLNNYVSNYYNSHLQQMKSYHNYNDFDKNFVVGEDMKAALRKAFVLQNAAYTQDVWSDKERVAFITTRVKALLAKMLYNTAGYVRVLNEDDATLKNALSLINAPEYDGILEGKATAPATTP